MAEQITTPAELDALPVGSVVLTEARHEDPHGLSYRLVFQRLYSGFWHRPGRSHDTDAGYVVPATVLYRPDAPAPSTEDRATLDLARNIVNQVLDGAVEQGGYSLVDMGARQRFNDIADRFVVDLLAARQPAPVGPDLAAIATTLGATTGWSRDDALAVLRALAEPAPVDAETGRVPAAAERQHACSAPGAAAAVVAQQVAREEAHVRLDAVGADLDVLVEVAAYGVPASDLLAFVRGYSSGGVDQRVAVVPVPGHPSRELVLHAGGRVSWRDAPGYDLAAERAVLDEEPEVRRG